MTGIIIRTRKAEYTFNGKPCPRGHVGARYKNGNCVQCLLDREALKQSDLNFAKEKRERENARYLADPEPKRESNRRWHAEHREETQEKKKAYYQENREELLERLRVYRENNREKVREQCRKSAEKNKDRRRPVSQAWRLRNAESLREKAKMYSAEHYKNNKAYYKAKKISRIRGMKTATPSWADFEEISAIYNMAAELSDETGVCMSVDHIIPLKGKNPNNEWVVCGLHVPWNMNVITLSENKKRNCYAWFNEVNQ